MFPDPPNDDRPTLADAAPRERGRHAAAGLISGRWFLPLVATGAAVVVLLVVLIALLLSAGPPAAHPEATSPTVSAEVSDDPTATASQAASSTPSASRSSSGTRRAADLLAALRTTIRQLGHADQLDDRAARSLDRLVRDAGRALTGGDVQRAQATLRTIAETVSRLRADGDLSAAGYETITKAISAIEQNLSQA